MKKNRLIISLVAMLFSLMANAESSDIIINEENFPDANFRNFLINQPYGKDGIITDEEIQSITILDIGGRWIYNLKGIEFFTALEMLHCYYNNLTSLDVSKNTALTYLSCYYNQLTSIDVSKNTALTYLECGGNQLTNIDVSNNTALTDLGCSLNQLTNIDVSNNTALTDLGCSYNQLSNLDVSRCTALTDLGCSFNQLSNLDVSNNTALMYLNCEGNQLTSLDVSINTALTKLFCYNNKIKGEAMGALIRSLPNQASAEMRVIDLSNSSEENVCTSIQVNTAKEKGWRVLTSKGEDYIGSNQTPDENLSGSCGDGANYTYEKANHTLTISGKGAIYDYDNSSNKAPWSSYADEIQKIEFESGITSIGDFAFYNCRSIMSLSIPATVGYIGSSAFEDCTNLASLSLNEGLLYIGVSAFAGCSGIQTLSIPSTVNTISINAFKNCKGITDVYCYAENVPDTHYKAFDGTPTEKSTLYVPASSVNAYRSSWPWSDFKNVVAIGSTPEDDLKDYIYEAGINNNWGTPEQPLYSANKDGIYRGFFYAQEADWSRGKGAFKFTGAFNSWEEGNYGLGHINADGLSGTLIDDGGSDNILATPGFYRADVNLVNMTYELTPISSIGIIGPAQPGGWDTDTDLTYNPQTLAWEGTIKLAADQFKFRANDSWDINWGDIISNLKQDGANLKIDEAGTYFIQFFPLCETKSYATITLVSDSTPGDDPTSGSCGETVDYSYDKATQTLTIFGKGAIYDYDNVANKAPWSAYADEIRKIEIESGITSIGFFAFYKCSGITSLSIPATVGYIGSSAFEDCMSLTSLALNEGLLSIGGSAFEGCSGLKTLTIPSTVNSISINAFKNCKGITNVYCYAATVPDTHFDVFDATPTEKATLHVPANSVEVYRTSWPWSDFQNIVGLDEDITEVEGVSYTVKGEAAVASMGVDVKDEVKIEESVEIDGNTYMVTAIAAGAFQGNVEITSVVIPNSIEAIGESAFEDCTGIISIIIGKAIREIARRAFADLLNDAGTSADGNGIDVYCYAEEVPNTADDAFDGTPTEKSTLHVPTSAIEKYRVSWPWSDFKEIVAIEEEGPDAIQGVKLSDDRNGDYYDLTGRKVHHPQKGFYIRNGKKVIVR